MIYQETIRQYNAPTENDFSLKVISKHPDTLNKEIVQHNLPYEALPLIGIKNLEAFEVHFSNNSREDCQVKISLDGVDIFNAKPASLEINKEMWVVRAGKTLHLRAWHETSNGGSQLVFTTGDKSVAYNTGADMAHKGVIATAVYTERNRPIYYYSSGMTFDMSQQVQINGSIQKGMAVNSGNVMHGAAASSSIYSSSPMPPSSAISNSISSPAVAGGAIVESNLGKTAMVGAGDYVEQKTHTTTGLKDPVLNHVKQIKYLFWEELEAKMTNDVQTKMISVLGFPEATQVKRFSNLDNVPKVSAPKANPFYKMIERVKNIW